MHKALFDSDRGYYASQIRTVGVKGDFSTTATLSPILGKALASRLSDWLRQNSGSFHVIEVGAGDGSLAKSFIDQLPWLLRLKLRYSIVDASNPLKKIQKKKLKKYKVTWCDTMGEALALSQGRACIFSNELVDAFATRVFKRVDENWLELYYDNGEESFRKTKNLPNSSALTLNHPEDYRVEVHESYYQWLEDWVPLWHEGLMITVDYGDTYPEIYHRRPHGSLRAFYMHEQLTGLEVYKNPGKIDITADVNFTDLMEESKKLGIKNELFQTQSEFLKEFSSGTTQDFYLLHPDGPGSAFKVLVQSK